MDQELREIHTAWLQRKDEEEQRNVRRTRECQVEGEDAIAAEAPAEVETPVVFVPQDLPAATIDIDLPSAILQDIRLPSVSHDVGSSSETLANVRAGMVSSPTPSISTISDLTPTELGEETEQMVARHDMFHFEDGNVDIVCGNTVFRVHSTIISFSSFKLRDILSPSALVHAPTPEGRPRITIPESAEDFGILLRMIYTPGWDFSSFCVSSAD